MQENSRARRASDAGGNKQSSQQSQLEATSRASTLFSNEKRKGNEEGGAPRSSKQHARLRLRAHSCKGRWKYSAPLSENAMVICHREQPQPSALEF